MITEVAGDILLTQAEAIAHGVAANDPMTHGLSETLHKNYPAMHKDFHHWCHTRHPKPGSAWIWSGVGGVRIINLITQEGGYGHGGRPGRARLSDVNHALRALKKLIAKEKLKSVALPRLATGVGGLDWSDVKPLVDNHLGESGAAIFLYSKYVPDRKAKEPGH